MNDLASCFRKRLNVWRTRAPSRLATATAFLAGVMLIGPTSLLAFEWHLSEFQPNIKNGGRASTFAQHPTSSKFILVTSETGGLFRSVDGGEKWHHVDSLPVFATNAVAYVDSSIVIATSLEDFKRSNGGGVWRSKDGGATWSHMPGPPIRERGQAAARLSAYEISIAPDTGKIYVATSFGCSMSSDKGETWTHSTVFPAGDPRVFSVLALNGNVVLAGGPAGLRRSADAGGTWSWPAFSGINSVTDIHAFGRSPVVQTQAYAVDNSTQLFYTENGGNSWTPIPSAPLGGGVCGGIAFVKAVRSVFDSDGLDLYFSNRCGVARLVCPRDWTTEKKRFDYSGSWVTLNTDHVDTRDLMLRASTPLLLATDGGLHKTADGGKNWTFIGRKNGYNALQITEVQGQWIDDAHRHDLYFGTQDNDLWSSSDGGKTWVNVGCGEGFFIEAAPHVPTESASKLTYVCCGPCTNVASGALFSSPAAWPDPQVNAAGNPTGNPKLVRPSYHVQGVDDSGSLSSGMAYTTTAGGAWEQWASFPEPRRDLPKLSNPGSVPVLYQAIQTGYDSAKDIEIDQLARIVPQILEPGIAVVNPAMNNFGGLGINPTMFAWYMVFGVDPSDVLHLIAPDVINERMMETWDGGENWTEIPQLTSLVTDGGKFLFRRGIFPHASAVSFCPDDPRIVAVGTVEGGIFISGDRGASWDKVPGSNRATVITSFHWKTDKEAIVSTYGRGLWNIHCPRRGPGGGFLGGSMADLLCKLEAALEATIPKQLPLSDFPRFCKGPCEIRPFERWRDDPVDRFSGAVLVFDGRIMGARHAEGIVRHLYVSPGSSVVFASDSQAPLQIEVTETSRNVGFGGSSGVPRPPKTGWIIKGLTIGEHGELRGAIFDDRPVPKVSFKEAAKQAEEAKQFTGRRQSPTVGRPSVRLISGDGAANTVSPVESMHIAGSGFKEGARVEIAMDGRPVDTDVSADPKGEFSATLPAPREFGLHRLTVRQQHGAAGGMMFLVRHVDEPVRRLQREQSKRSKD